MFCSSYLTCSNSQTAKVEDHLGPGTSAETDTPHHNDAFTDIAAILALREAAALGQALREHVPPHWREVADHLVIPMIEGSDVIANRDLHTRRR
ncbi:hypothetical protein [Catellatospora sp. NPDC049609]|uniref:hypothetical protein n=1 Tax=Catellatospora sp. NPDC049609 TaxID=3155505 RepID=UPI00342F358C